MSIDTEFMRRSTYFPALCLVQLANDDACLLIDALDADISPLAPLLLSRSITKIFHAPQQDIEILYSHIDMGGSPIAPIYDTQLAASFTGLEMNMGYRALVKELTGRDICKDCQDDNWKLRPLTAKQMEYAALDVKLLGRMRDILTGRMRDAGHYDWFAEDISRLYGKPVPAHLDVRDAWKKLRIRGEVEGRKMRLIEQLAAWREERAIERDVPRRWMMSDDSIFALAGKSEELTVEKIQRIIGKSRLRKRDFQALPRVISKARDMEPLLIENSIPSREIRRLAKELRNKLMDCASEHNIPPTLIATGRAIEQLATYIHSETSAPQPPSHIMHGWRHEIYTKLL